MRNAYAHRILATGALGSQSYQQYVLSLISLGALTIWDAGGSVYTDTGLTALALDGNEVAGWADQSNNGYHLTEATAKPDYDIDGVNNLPAVVFTAANTDKLKRSIAGIVANRTVYNIIVVYKTSATALQTIYAEGNSGDTTPLCALRLNLGVAGRISWQHRGDGSTIAQISTAPTPAANDGNNRLATARRTASNAFDLRVDGTSIGTSSSAPGTTTVDGVGAGVFPTMPDSNYFQGSIAHISIYPTDVYVDAEVIIAQRYGVTLS